jgi:hypothetical protein
MDLAAGSRPPAPGRRVECMVTKLKEVEVSFETPSSLFRVSLDVSPLTPT